MLGHQQRRRGTHYRNRQAGRDLQVCWANVAKGQPSHITILQVAFTEKIDVICIQEPSTYPGTRTQNHPGYDCYAPIESWESTDAT